MTNVTIRGGIGTQVLGFAINLARYGDKITSVSYNTGNYPAEQRKIMKAGSVQEYIDKCLDIIFPIKYKNVPNGKTILNDESIEHALKNITRAIFYAGPKRAEGFDRPILHVRKHDYDTLSDQSYFDLITKYDCENIVTDSVDHCKKFGLNYTTEPENTIGDWLKLANSRTTCVGPFSTFTLMAAYFNPALELKVVEPQEANGHVWGGHERIESGKRHLALFVKHLSNVSYA